ncbi:MAG: hypothetical protein ACLFWG_08920 [Longimicrobiales bacterium]
MKLSIQLTEAQERRLNEIASRLNVPAQSLAKAALRDLIERPDPEFDQVATRLIEKNKELYERLR